MSPMPTIRVRDEDGAPVIQALIKGQWETVCGTDTPTFNDVKHWVRVCAPEQADAVLADYEATKRR